ncbi:identified by similarity to PIR:G97485 [hydrothermal vent metagenome]|uniref:Identified by similarity to PIR:G97485 n=1 Tax=hydrothermal vent metagenome TaxID=652676 RepID=A0A3B0RJR1_9ZZZZ
MVFKRRDRRSVLRATAEFFWPRRGWTRAVYYVWHRLRRLPDPPHRIARGIFVGIFVTFSPLFGLHFLLAFLLAKLIRGNVIAAILATFVGNPLTFFFIALSSLNTGHFLLSFGANTTPTEIHSSLGEKFVNASSDLKHNFYAMFNDTQANWYELRIFFNEVFLPYLVGGIIPGAIAGLIGYYISLPLIQVYQNRRKGLIKAKWAERKEKKAAKVEAKKASSEEN